MAKVAKVPDGVSAPRAPGSRMWLKGLGCGALVTMATPTAVLAALLLTPAVVAWIADPTPDHRAAKPVLVWGFAATVHPMMALWTGGHTVALAFGVAGDLPVIATCWSVQAGAWLVVELLPVVIAAGLNAACGARAARLRQARAVHEAEWDIPPVPPEV